MEPNEEYKCDYLPGETLVTTKKSAEDKTLLTTKESAEEKTPLQETNRN